MTAAEHSQEQRVPTVLVIDDEDYVADILASALTMEGYSVHLAYNGRDGLALAQKLQVDLVILDMMMPYINGIELIEELRKLDHTRDVPILLISAGPRPRHSLPNVQFIAKPIDLDRTLEVVAAILDVPDAGS